MARLIDGDALIAWIKGSRQMTSKMKSIICYIKTMPTVDAVSVVRCKDCKYWNPWHCSQFNDHTHEVDYCSYGERRDHE